MQKRRTRKGKNNKGFPSESILAVGFGICILGLAAINLFWSDHEMSEQENRMLASKPKLCPEIIWKNMRAIWQISLQGEIS